MEHHLMSLLLFLIVQEPRFLNLKQELLDLLLFEQKVQKNLNLEEL
jgi:hypothetical protein